MTRTDVMASSRPLNVTAAPSMLLRGLRAIPVALALALAVMVPSTALASTEGYAQEPNKPAATTPKTGTLPSKEEEKPATSTPTTETAPTNTATTPATSSPTASTLPFTGFDLRWDIGFGVVLLGAGFSILAMQRRQRRSNER